MTKQAKTLNRLAVMASAVIVTLYSQAALAQKGPGIIERTKQKGRELKEAYDATKTAFDFKDHFFQFVESTSWRDVFGRSTEAGLFIAILWLGLVLIAFRKGEKMKPAELYTKPIIRYFLAMLVGYGYELVRSYPEYSAGMTGALTLPVIFLGIGLFLNVKLFYRLAQAFRHKEVGYFLRTFKLPPWAGGEPLEEEEDKEASKEHSEDEELEDGSEASEEVEEEAEDADEEEGDEEEAPSEDTPPPRKEPSWARGEALQEELESLCPHCNAPIEPEDRFCGSCEKPLKAEAAPVAGNCPSCAAATGSDDQFCGECGARLSTCPHCGARTEAGDRFCGSCEKPLGKEVKTRPTRKNGSSSAFGLLEDHY